MYVGCIYSVSIFSVSKFIMRTIIQFLVFVTSILFCFNYGMVPVFSIQQPVCKPKTMHELCLHNKELLALYLAFNSQLTLKFWLTIKKAFFIIKDIENMEK